MRATAAKPRLALRPAGGTDRQRPLFGGQHIQPGIHAGADVSRHTQFFQPLGDGPGNDGRAQVGIGAQQPVRSRVGLAPFTTRLVTLGTVFAAVK